MTASASELPWVVSPRIRTTPSFQGRQAATVGASSAARGSSKKSATKCELVLRRALHARGLRYRTTVAALPGTPDIVFAKARVAVFCDGDFWHGRDLDARLQKLSVGTNAPYWVAKIRSNVERDERNTLALEARGWTVLRYWERDIHREANRIAAEIERVVRPHSGEAQHSASLRASERSLPTFKG